MNQEHPSEWCRIGSRWKLIGQEVWATVECIGECGDLWDIELRYCDQNGFPNYSTLHAHSDSFQEDWEPAS